MPNYTQKDQCFREIGFKPDSRRTYLVFFKPYEILSQFTQEPGSQKRTLAEFGFPKEVYPVGRLDYDSEGLLLLSDDGRLNSALLSPENGHWRTYLAQVENIPEPAALRLLASGITIEGRKTRPAEAELLDYEPELPEREKPIRYRKNIPTSWLTLKLQEGRNRQVRKMTAAVGHPTLRLLRIKIGELDLFTCGIKPGQWRQLSIQELLKAFA